MLISFFFGYGLLGTDFSWISPTDNPPKPAGSSPEYWSHLREGNNYRTRPRRVPGKSDLNSSQVRRLRRLKQLIVYNATQFRDSLSFNLRRATVQGSGYQPRTAYHAMCVSVRTLVYLISDTSIFFVCWSRGTGFILCHL